MVVEDYQTPVLQIFRLSKVVAAYPVTTASTLYSLAMVFLSFASVGLIFVDEFLAEPVEETATELPKGKNPEITTTITTTQSPNDTSGPQSTTISPADSLLTFEPNPKLAETIWNWMANIQNVEDVLICIILFLGLQSYRNGDIERLIDVIRNGHNRILNLGLTPKYRNWRGIFLVLLSIIQAFLVYYATVRIEETWFSYAVMKSIMATVLPRFIGHAYITQFFCLMELVQDQVECLISGLDKEDQWYLESLISIQIDLIDSAYCVFDMFVMFISTCIVHSAIALLVNAYKVTQHQMNFYAILVIFEMLVLIRVIHACGRTKAKVDQFNTDLFKRMRASQTLCDNTDQVIGNFSDLDCDDGSNTIQKSLQSPTIFLNGKQTIFVKKLYLFLTTQQSVSFSAGGFFEISYSTIVSIVAATTTYLVILVQLSKPK